MKCRSRKKNDIILILFILALAIGMLGVFYITGVQLKNPVLQITVGGELYGTYPLSEDRTISIGDTNVCEIRDGEVTMTQADCPDQICVHHIPIDASGGSIVCLPNKVVLEIVNADGSGEYDTIVR